MTLAIAFRGCDGLVLASDSRITGQTSADIAEKFLQVNRDIGVMTFGIAEPGIKGIKRLVDTVKEQRAAYFSQISDMAKTVFLEEFNTWKTEFEKQGFQYQHNNHIVGFILAGYDSNETNQFKIKFWESPSFDEQDREDIMAAQWFITRVLQDYLFYPQMNVEQLKKLAIMSMIYTSTYEPTVGGPIQLAAVNLEKGFRKISEEEICLLISQTQTQIAKFRNILLQTFACGTPNI